MSEKARGHQERDDARRRWVIITRQLYSMTIRRGLLVAARACCVRSCPSGGAAPAGLCRDSCSCSCSCCGCGCGCWWLCSLTAARGRVRGRVHRVRGYRGCRSDASGEARARATAIVCEHAAAVTAEGNAAAGSAVQLLLLRGPAVGSLQRLVPPLVCSEQLPLHLCEQLELLRCLQEERGMRSGGWERQRAEENRRKRNDQQKRTCCRESLPALLLLLTIHSVELESFCRRRLLRRRWGRWRWRRIRRKGRLLSSRSRRQMTTAAAAMQTDREEHQTMIRRAAESRRAEHNRSDPARASSSSFCPSDEACSCFASARNDVRQSCQMVDKKIRKLLRRRLAQPSLAQQSVVLPLAAAVRTFCCRWHLSAEGKGVRLGARRRLACCFSSESLKHQQVVPPPAASTVKESNADTRSARLQHCGGAPTPF